MVAFGSLLGTAQESDGHGCCGGSGAITTPPPPIVSPPKPMPSRAFDTVNVPANGIGR